MTIVEFLLARIADDEAVASDKPLGAFFERHTMDYRASEADGFGYAWTSRFRVLAECAAKRQIIKHCTETLEDSSGGYTSGALLAERVLNSMSAVYADHPDYDPDAATVHKTTPRWQQPVTCDHDKWVEEHTLCQAEARRICTSCGQDLGDE